MAEYTNYSITQFKQQEQDDGFMSSSSPSPEASESQSFLSNTQRMTLAGVGVYAASQVYSEVSSNIKNLTGSTRKQEQIKRLSALGTSAVAAIATNGASLVFQGIQLGIQETVRRKVVAIENEARQEERELLGQRITNSMGSAYYD